MENVVSLCEYRNKIELIKREKEMREIEELETFVDAWIEYFGAPEPIIFQITPKDQDYFFHTTFQIEYCL